MWSMEVEVLIPRISCRKIEFWYSSSAIAGCANTISSSKNVLMNHLKLLLEREILLSMKEIDSDSIC